jgi:hypothetical protein
MNKIFRIKYKDKLKNNYELDIIPADDSNLSSPVIVNLDGRILEKIDIDINRGETLAGLGNVTAMTIELNIKYFTNELRDVIRQRDAYYEIAYTHNNDNGYITNPSFISPTLNINENFGNMYVLKVNNIVSYIGFQNSTINGNIDNNIIKIEIWHIVKTITEKIDLRCLDYLGMLNDVDAVKEGVNAYDYIFYYNHSTYKIYSKACLSPPNSFFYFIRINTIFTYLSTLYKVIAAKITRDYFDNNVFNDAVLNTTNITYFKQTYNPNFAKGDALNYDNIYLLMFIANKNLANRNADGFFYLKSYYDVLENYKNCWDFLNNYYKSNLVRATQDTYKISYTKLLEGRAIIIDGLEREIPSFDFDYNILYKTEAAAVERNDKDIDKIEFIKVGARSQTTDNLSVIINTMVSGQDDLQGGGGSSSFSSIKNQLKIGNNFVYSVHKNPYMLKPYYFEQAVNTINLTTEEVWIGANSNIEIDLGAGVVYNIEYTNSLDMSLWKPSVWAPMDLINGSFISLMQRTGGSLVHRAIALSNVFDGSGTNIQINIDGKFDVGECYKREDNVIVCGVYNPLLTSNYSKFIYDSTILQDLFANVSNELYLISAKLDLSCSVDFVPTMELRLIGLKYD